MFRTGPQLLTLFGAIITPWQHKTGLFFLDCTQLMGKIQDCVVFSGKPNKQEELGTFSAPKRSEGRVCMFEQFFNYSDVISV